MTIKLAAYPKSGVDLILNALADMESGTEKSALGGAHEQEISEPIPVFTLGLKFAAAGLLPSDIAPTIFRYLMFSGEDVSVADVTMTGVGNEVGEFNRISTGAIVDRFNSALSYVDEKFANSEIEFEIRALEIPAINQAVIWLFAPTKSVFVPYLDSARLKGEPPTENTEFLSEMAEHAAQIQRDGSN